MGLILCCTHIGPTGRYQGRHLQGGEFNLVGDQSAAAGRLQAGKLAGGKVGNTKILHFARGL